MKFGVVRFPGSCDEIDAQLAARRVGEAVLLWHSDRDLHGIYDSLATRLGFVTEEQDVSPLFVGAAAILLIVGGGLATLWFHRFP